MRWLEGNLQIRRLFGNAVLISVIGLGLASLISCLSSPNSQRSESDVSRDTSEIICDSINESAQVDEFVNQVASEPAEIDGVTQPEDPNDNRDCPTK